MRNIISERFPAFAPASVASGLSASAGIVYMMGGSDQQVLDTMRNVLGSISGMICDGAKEGCASKVCLSTGLSVMSAMMALNGMSTKPADGILADQFEGSVYQSGQHRQCRHGARQCGHCGYYAEKIKRTIKNGCSASRFLLLSMFWETYHWVGRKTSEKQDSENGGTCFVVSYFSFPERTKGFQVVQILLKCNTAN